MAVQQAKARFKQEAAQVLLGEREEVSAELRAAQIQGYRNELKRQRKGQGAGVEFKSPRVREPDGGFLKEKKLDRQFYLQRQAAGGGIPAGSLTSQERNWNETISTLFGTVAL